MTAQAHEVLILEGTQTSMAFCPPIPEHPKIKRLSQEEFDQKAKANEVSWFVGSTACWRGYIGTWELKDGKLYLNEVRGHIFYTGEPIFADWVTGVLRIPSGELLHYVHMGYGSVYEFETHIKLENGLVIEERKIDNRKKDVNPSELGWKNLPGNENKFDGDDL